jgi:hypothetical protein
VICFAHPVIWTIITDVQTDTVQNTTTVEIHNTTQEGESTTEDIEQFQSIQKVAFSKTNSTKNSKASAKKITMKYGLKTMETFMKTPVSYGPKQTYTQVSYTGSWEPLVVFRDRLLYKWPH